MARSISVDESTTDKPCRIPAGGSENTGNTRHLRLIVARAADLCAVIARPNEAGLTLIH